MSSKTERTRAAILEATWRVVKERGPGLARVRDVAAEAGVSRQAVYLHFPSRAALLVGLVEYMDRELGLGELLSPVREAPTPREALVRSLRVTARYAAQIHDVAQALDLARHADEDAAAAWEDRMSARRRGIRRIVKQLHEAGELREGWSVARATDAVWALGAPHTYADLVVDRGWSTASYEQFLVTAALAFLR